MIKETPGIEQGSHTFFRDLQEYGKLILDIK